MRILAIVTGEYGSRHVENIQKHAPSTWMLEYWRAPNALPLMIDYPEDHVPDTLPPADLILSFAEYPGVAELVPDIARMTGAKAVIAAVDNESWLPRGLARQLCGWLADIGVACVTPKPLCSLTETGYSVARRQQVSYEDQWISEFARYFGQPDLKITVDPQSRTITGAEVVRDAVCGCARYVAKGLVGVSADAAGEKSGLLHHHFPCLASMGVDPGYEDTLLHVSGNLIKDNVIDQIKPFRHVQQVRPGGKVE